jgi:hypothetical protein
VRRILNDLLVPVAPDPRDAVDQNRHERSLSAFRFGNLSRPGRRHILSLRARRPLSGCASAAGMQPGYRLRQRRDDRLPSGNRPGAFLSPGVVGDAGEPAAQFDSSRQLALLIKDSADCGGISFGDDEHGTRMEGHPRPGKQSFYAPHRTEAGQTVPPPVSGTPA